MNSAADHSPLLAVQGLACERGDETLFSGFNLTLARGEIVQIAGPNGAGKTTLLRSLCGLFDANFDALSWCGTPVESPLEYADELLYLGHRPAIRNHLTLAENIELFAALATGADLSRVADLIWQLGLRGYEEEPASSLSAGQKRRLALMRLGICEAKLWVLDEPFAALDAAGVALLRDWITAFTSSGGAVLYSTHQPVSFPGCEMRIIDLGGHKAC